MLLLWMSLTSGQVEAKGKYSMLIVYLLFDYVKVEFGQGCAVVREDV